MATEKHEISVRGIILSSTPQGEYGKRLILLTDQLGKISVFASGAARTGSRLIGLVRPLTMAEFTLKRGKSAWNLHEVKVLDAFTLISSDPDVCFYAFYTLETAEYFSVEGMPQAEAKGLLNLMFVTLCALRDSIGKLKEMPGLIRSIYELRLLRLEGEYTSTPENEENKEIVAMWMYTLGSPLSKLYKNLPKVTKDTASGFEKDVNRLFKRQVQKKFNSEKLIGRL